MENNLLKHSPMGEYETTVLEILEIFFSNIRRTSFGIADVIVSEKPKNTNLATLSDTTLKNDNIKIVERNISI